MTDDVLHEGAGEGFKGAVHCAVGFGLGICAAYNAAAASARRGPCWRLRLQALGYAIAAIWEARQTYGHWSGQL